MGTDQAGKKILQEEYNVSKIKELGIGWEPSCKLIW